MKQLATNLEQNRFNMVEQQIRTWNVLDTNILDLLYKVRREEYVPAAYRSLAFTDMEEINELAIISYFY